MLGAIPMLIQAITQAFEDAREWGEKVLQRQFQEVGFG